ncbi:MAG: right-handed parallel beta-helix repeat-containing protein, partial [Ignavibacteria bacterium]|nr:right-handed parallel beta-helix repeat-containing protein [Ignavibacteria bacterium]
DLYYVIKNNFSPRLKGTLGKTLLGLNYIGIYLALKHIIPTQNPVPQPPSYDYLTIGLQATNHDMNWQVGFFDRTNHNDDKYFLMTNLWTNSPKQIQIRVTPPVQGYTNYRFRNIEPQNNFDITFKIETTPTLSFPAGEGYLFQVAPVVKYGGKLVYNETVLNGTTLYDDMTIENGATLTINGTYTAKANITVKSGGKIVAGTNGKIIFDPGKKIIVKGSAQINGTASDRLSLEFSTSTAEGIVVKPGGALYLSYADVKNAQIGINAEQGSGQINISNVNLTACSQYGIALIGLQGDGSQTPPPPTVYKCNITGSLTGISAANYNEILIRENTLSGSGISIASVTSAFIQGNIIDGGSSSPFAGIFMNNSSGGYIRCNLVTNCLNGIRLGNSSPDIGDNTLQHNKYHGLYIGYGSIPNMLGRIIRGLPYTWYGASGYNRIRENGMGITFGEPPDNDGSEIYFSSSSALLGSEK